MGMYGRYANNIIIFFMLVLECAIFKFVTRVTYTLMNSIDLIVLRLMWLVR